MKPYSERIPAAIAKAEDELGDSEWMFLDIKEEVAITATEVALAKALWEDSWGIRSPLKDGPHPALRAFCEKVEALG